MLRTNLIILKWLVKWWYPDVNQAHEAIGELSSKVSLWTSTKGSLWVINHLKEIKLLYTRALCGAPVYKSSRLIGIRKDGLPKGFPILNSIFLRGTNNDIRFILTLLSISRTIKAWKDPDLSPITNSYKGSIKDFSIFEPFIAKYFQDFNLETFNYEWGRKDHYYSIKAGPNGLATWLAPMDAIPLPERFKENLKVLSLHLYNEAVPWSFNNPSFRWPIFRQRNSKKEEFPNLLRKLSIVKDPDGKSRIIAILDYWSQSALRPIHNHVFGLLKKIKTDRTFTQDPIVSFPGPYYSLDLSSATDRFPIAFQRKVVERLLADKDKARVWEELLTSLDYKVPWDGSTVKYTVGQPMGAYSSWAIFTLSHHIITQYAALQVGQYPTSNYIILGDDIVIGGEDLAKSYIKVMEELGVDISSHKTHVSTNTYEFAKRWFRNGVEVSGIQVKAFEETRRNYSLLYQTLRTYISRGLYPRHPGSYPELIGSLLRSFNVYNRKVTNIERKVELMHAMKRWIIDGDGEEIRKVLLNQAPLLASLPHSSHPMFHNLIMIRMNMAYEVMHAESVEKVENLMNQIESSFNQYFPDPDQIYDDDNASDDDIFEKVLSYSEINNLPAQLSLRNLIARLVTDYRISTSNSDLASALDALVLPDLERIGSKSRSNKVTQTFAKFGQRVMVNHKRLTEGRWMIELSQLNRLAEEGAG